MLARCTEGADTACRFDNPLHPGQCGNRGENPQAERGVKAMTRIMNSTTKRLTLRGFFLDCIISLAMQPFTASTAFAATTVPVLWTAGGVSGGIDTAGYAARMATDASGNVAVVSGPAAGGGLAVTSYTAARV